MEPISRKTTIVARRRVIGVLIAGVGLLVPFPAVSRHLAADLLCEEIPVGPGGPIAVREYQGSGLPPRPVTIDVMVLYTRNAVRARHQDSLHSVFLEVNRIYRETGVTFRIVGAFSMNAGSGLDQAAARAEALAKQDKEAGTDLALLDLAFNGLKALLSRVTWDERVDRLRSQVGADLVVTWIDGGRIGLSYRPGSSWLFGAYTGYSLVRDRDSITVAHELGHNLGLAHQPAASPSAHVHHAHGYQGSHPSISLPYLTLMGSRQKTDGSLDHVDGWIPELSRDASHGYHGVQISLGGGRSRARDAVAVSAPWVADYMATVKQPGERPDDTDGLLTPAGPTDLNATPGDGHVVLSWNAPGNPGTTAYEVRFGKKGKSLSSWTDIRSSGALTTRHTVAGLENDSTYRFRVRARNGPWPSPSSDVVRATPSAALGGPTAPMVVSLGIVDVRAAEDGAITFEVTATPAPVLDATFKYTVTAESSDTAAARNDFVAVKTATAGMVAANSTSATITVEMIDDGLDEGSETFTVTLSEPSDNATIGAATATGTILDDDSSPVLASIADRTVGVGQTVDITAAATDGDSDPITYSWTRESSEASPPIPGGTALNQARLTFTATAPGTYTMTVTASDGNGNSDTEEVVVAVRQAGPVDDGSDGGGDSPSGNPGGNDGGSSDGGGPGTDGGSSGGGSGPPGEPGGNGGGSGGPGGNDGGNGGPAGGGDGSDGNGGGAGAGGGGSGGGSDGSTNGDRGDDDDGGTTGDSADDDGDDDDDDRAGPGGNDDGDSGGVGGDVRASFTLDAPCADGLCRARTGVPVSFRDASSGAVASWSWSLGDGTTARSRSLEHAWSVPGFYTVSLTVSGRGPSSTVSRTVLVEAADPVGTCAADAETLCLQDSRFSVTMDWWTEDGAESKRGAGKVVHEGTNDSGLFWFFSAVNWELLVKVLDGCSVNGRMWVYGASATTLGYVLEVTDTVTGAVQEYRSEPGRQAEAFTDSAAFPGSCTDAATAAAAAGDSRSLPTPAPSSGPPPAEHLAVATSVTASAEGGSCTETASAMCLQQGRYEVTVEWSNHDGLTGTGRTAGPRTDDSGLFHFFSPTNWEILIKVLDGCSFNDHHWVFAASATDVGFNLQVRDTATGRIRQYTKQPGNPARALVDISAFPESCRQP